MGQSKQIQTMDYNDRKIGYKWINGKWISEFNGLGQNGLDCNG